MNEYLIHDTTLKELGDEIRILSGTENELAPSEMTSNVRSANEEVTTQSAQIVLNADLIAQIRAALEGKASAKDLEALLQSVTAIANDIRQGKSIINSQGDLVEGTQPTRTEDDLTANGATVSVPAGIYDSPVSKSVLTVNQGEIEIDEVPEDGAINIAVNQAEGYVPAGRKAAVHQMATQGAKTITPTKSAQTAVEQYVYTTDIVQVAPIPDEYQDVTPVTAGIGDVRSGKTIVNAQGQPIQGTQPTRSENDLTVSGSTVNVPAGIYDSEVSKTIETVTLHSGTETPVETIGEVGDLYIYTGED